MLLYVGFTEEEIFLLNKAAVQLNVDKRCKYIAEIGALDEQGTLIDSDAISTIYPSVIFLNLDASTEHWKESLTDLKHHPRLRGVPVVGLGRIPEREENQFYELRGNSYIRKPNTFEEMAHAASVALNFWLEISQLPGKHISDT